MPVNERREPVLDGRIRVRADLQQCADAEQWAVINGMTETMTSVLALILLLIGLPVLMLWIIDQRRHRQRAREHPPGSDIAERQAYEHRILNPDWACVERHLMRPAPQALRTLYGDAEFITRRNLRYVNDHAISAFEPLDEEAILATRRWLGFEALAIARTDFDDTVYLRPGVDEIDTVYLTYHDGGDTEVFAESLTEMLTVLRRSNPPT
jgi:hypothetical protein